VCRVFAAKSQRSRPRADVTATVVTGRREWTTQPKTGLGTGVVNALAKQLDAQVVTLSGALGTKVSVTHATFAAA
jgi:two-component sensor histidine kinase